MYSSLYSCIYEYTISSRCTCYILCQVARQILDAHSSMLNMSLMDAKMQYIRNWQALSGFGITYFVIRLGKSRKDVREVEGREGRCFMLSIC